MGSNTWIDKLSDFLLGSLDRQGLGQPFSTDQVDVLQQLLTKSFEMFGREVGKVVGNKLAEHDATIKIQLDSFSDRCEATTVCVQEDVGKGNAKNQRRKLRRRRAKEKHQYSRAQLLCVGRGYVGSPEKSGSDGETQCASANGIKSARCVEESGLVDVNVPLLRVQRLETVERSEGSLLGPLAGFVDGCELASDDDSAALLAAQCRSINRIQRAWRKHCCNIKARALIAELDLDVPVYFLSSRMRTYQFVRPCVSLPQSASLCIDHSEASDMDKYWQLDAGVALEELLDRDLYASNEAFSFLTNSDIRLLLMVSRHFGTEVITRLVSQRRRRLPAIRTLDG